MSVLNVGDVATLNAPYLVFGMGWDLLPNCSADFDASCVAFDAQGNVVDTAYYGNLAALGGALVHSGDNRTGEGVGDDESLTVNLTAVPLNVVGLCFVVTSYSGEPFQSIKTAKARILDPNGVELFSMYIGATGNHTGILLCKLYRVMGADGNPSWSLHCTDNVGQARTFGDMVPVCQQSLSQAFPTVQIQRFAIPVVRKGERVSISPNLDILGVGLQWDVLPGKNIDLDASCICLDAFGNRVETVFFANKIGSRGAIVLPGDNVTGEGDGDDENLFFALKSIDPGIFMMVITVTMFTRNESFRSVKTAKARIFDRSWSSILEYPLCQFADSNALIVAALHRTTLGWRMVALGQSAVGNTAEQALSDVQAAAQPILASANLPAVMQSIPQAFPIPSDFPPKKPINQNRTNFSTSSSSTSSGDCCVIL